MSDRIVILDTETTGMNKSGPQVSLGHNIIEIGAVEVINRKLTGNNFHVYIKPPRKIDREAIEVHGITDIFLDDKPFFKDVCGEFLQYLQNSEIVAHNAPFDLMFLNSEIQKVKCDKNFLLENTCKVTDSLMLAKKKYPGKRNNLDALCSRLGIDNSKRVQHGALLDSEILADVYLLLTGGQINLLFNNEMNSNKHSEEYVFEELNSKNRDRIYSKLCKEEEEIHLKFLQLLSEKTNKKIIW